MSYHRVSNHGDQRAGNPPQSYWPPRYDYPSPTCFSRSPSQSTMSSIESNMTCCSIISLTHSSPASWYRSSSYTSPVPQSNGSSPRIPGAYPQYSSASEASFGGIRSLSPGSSRSHLNAQSPSYESTHRFRMVEPSPAREMHSERSQHSVPLRSQHRGVHNFRATDAGPSPRSSYEGSLPYLHNFRETERSRYRDRDSGYSSRDSSLMEWNHGVPRIDGALSRSTRAVVRATHESEYASSRSSAGSSLSPGSHHDSSSHSGYATARQEGLDRGNRPGAAYDGDYHGPVVRTSGYAASMPQSTEGYSDLTYGGTRTAGRALHERPYHDDLENDEICLYEDTSSSGDDEVVYSIASSSDESDDYSFDDGYDDYDDSDGGYDDDYDDYESD